jgi:hypothetical protein
MRTNRGMDALATERLEVSEDFARRLSLIEDERAITRLLYRYSHAIDRGDSDGWVACFTEDGAFSVRGEGVDFAPTGAQGRAALLAFAKRHAQPADFGYQHMVVEPLIDLDGSTARCVSFFVTLVENDATAPVPRAFGRYEDEVVRDADGQWRFRTRTTVVRAQNSDIRPLTNRHD